MGDEIIIPEMWKFKGNDIIENLRDRLCSGEKECGDIGKYTECVKCAFYTNKNFDKFIKQVGS